MLLPAQMKQKADVTQITNKTCQKKNIIDQLLHYNMFQKHLKSQFIIKQMTLKNQSFKDSNVLLNMLEH